MTVEEIREKAWQFALMAESLKNHRAAAEETMEVATTSIAMSMLLIEQQLDQIRQHLQGDDAA